MSGLEACGAEHMDNSIILCAGLTLAVFLGAAGYIFIQRKQTELLMERLEEMLEAAIDGSFKERHFDESHLSSIEARLCQYLRRQAGKEQELSKEQGEIHSLLADISHQTKTPIANLLLYAGLISEQAPKETRELACQLNAQAEKLKFLIDSLIKSSRLERGIIQLSPKEHSVRQLLYETAEAGAPAALQKQVRIQCQVKNPAGEKEDDTACFDYKWTAEALWNILDNGIKYTNQGDTVLIKGSPYELFYRIDIVDHGMGIQEEEIPKIFQRFYRSGQAQNEEGVGLGLYLAREIIRAQGGYIKVTSGKETVFSIFLPKKSGQGGV